MADLFNTNTILAPVAPALPFAPVEYERKYQDDLNNILRLYFATQDNAFANLLSAGGGRYIRFPYGAFQDTTTQTIPANTAQVVALNTTDYANEVSIVAGSKITVANAGLYNLQWSGQFQNPDNAHHDISVWLRKGDVGAGVDIVGSTGLISIPARKSAVPGQEGHLIVGWNYFVELQANEFVEIWWSTTSAQVTLEAYPATTGPVRPSTASVIATLSFVSAPLT